MRISEELVDEIEVRMRKIQDSPEYFSERAKVFEEELKHLSDIHSFWMEYPEMRRTLLTATNTENERDLKEEAKKGVKRIRNAWNYLTSDHMKESKIGVLGYLNLDSIKEVGRRVELVKNKYGFRRNIIFSPFDYTAASPDLIIPMLTNLCQDLTERRDENPIIPYGERNIYLNLLNDALNSYKEYKEDRQKPFFNYIAGKVATALDDIIGDLKIK